MPTSSSVSPIDLGAVEEKEPCSDSVTPYKGQGPADKGEAVHREGLIYGGGCAQRLEMTTCEGPLTIKVLAFDVFGTVVDWRGGITREAITFFAKFDRPHIDPATFADEWRALYQPAMEECRSGRRPYVRLDVLNRETLETLLVRHGMDIAAIAERRLADFAHAWRRLDPWPDAVPALTRLKRRYPIVTLSNGNVALMLEMARRGGLAWDAILGAEATQTYKPMPQAYRGTAKILGLEPPELCLVAAHHSDLAAARACGLATAFVARPDEYGGRAAPDLAARQSWDFEAGDLEELAKLLER